MKANYAILLLAAALFVGCNNKTTEPVETIIRISNPVDGATLTDPVTVTATAGAGYDFTLVDFYIDGDSVWSDSTSPFQYYWDIFAYTGVTNHTIYAIGYTTDSSYVSTAVSVQVSLASGFSFLSAYTPNSLICYGVANYQNAMFVATGTPGMEVVSIVDKNIPAYVSRYDTPGQAVKAAVVYPYVFIADGAEGVTRADFSNPDSLIQRGIYTSQSAAYDVAASPNYLYVAENDGVSIVDYSDPNNLSYVSRVGMSGQDQPQFLTVRNDTAFVAAVDKLYIIDCTAPSTPHIVSTFTTVGQARQTAVDGDLVFVADGSNGVLIISIASPASPVELGRFSANDQFNAIAVDNSTLFAGTLSGTVYALDYSQPDTPAVIDQFETGNEVYQIHPDFPYLLAATSGNVSILRFLP